MFSSPFYRATGILLCLGLALGHFHTAAAQSLSLAEAAEKIRAALVNAQLSLASDPSQALGVVQDALKVFEATISPQMSASAPEHHNITLAGFAQMQESAQEGDADLFAASRARVWTAILAGSVQIVETAVQNGETSLARQWLTVREFRTATRFTRPGADATLAVERLARDEISAAEALLALRADLLDTYQARLEEALRALPEADKNGFASRRAELAALAEGYFAILAPAYSEQRGAPALDTARQAFSGLSKAALSGQGLPEALQSVDQALDGFRAAPLSPAEQARRAGQLLRFIYLVPVEYGRGVQDGRVIHNFELQEAASFHAAAYAAFADLENLLPPEKAAPAAGLLDQIGERLSAAGQGVAVADPGEMQRLADELKALLEEAMPQDWLAGSSQGDFEVVAALLDQVVTAVENGEYELAESARLEAYAVLETGPEARLVIFAPHYKPELEALFWNGQDETKGLAYLIKVQAAPQAVRATHARLTALLAEVEQVLGRGSSPVAVATNAGIIVFREGMEAVVILASLMSSMRRLEERKYRRPMWLGALAAFFATLLTWLLARGVLQGLARYGEKLEAVVSLIAVGILLVIMNWFFHKMYWTSWIARFHNRKRRLINGEAGLTLGLIILGFTSVYREGFEVVIFLQALVLEAGSGVVLAGTAAGLLLVLLLGVVAFRLQVNLPYRNMLIITGILIGGVLMQMVGKTVYVTQIVGWLPIHTLPNISFPYWLGTWFGIYPTWEGLTLQSLAALFVIGSYSLAEWMQKHRRLGVSARAA